MSFWGLRKESVTTPLVAEEGVVAVDQGEDTDTVAARWAMLQPHPLKTLGSSRS